MVNIIPVEGTFVATGESLSFATANGFNMSISGLTAGSGTIVLQRSFDQGVTFLDVESYTADAQKRVDDPEVGVYYQLECTVYSSGTFLYRLSA